MKRKVSMLVAAILLVCLTLCSCNVGKRSPIDYSQASSWAFCEDEGDKKADVFLIAPTVFYGDEETFNMPIDNEKNRSRIVGALNMQLGIYNSELNVFSPYYRQVSLSAVSAGTYKNSLPVAFDDIAASFGYYMKYINDGRPFVLAGFSQGAEMCVMLMKEYPDKLDNMIACYLFGYGLTPEEVAEYPQIVPAQGETDTGVVVCINSEAPDVTDTFTVPAGTKSICINPLNWKTDETPADKTLNKGACFLDYDGSITQEADEFTGAYIDTSRGTLKLPDINPDDYTTKLTFIKYGEYHMYEYEFFYRNVQQNVADRIESYFAKYE